MRNFSKFLEDRDHDMYSEIFNWGKKKPALPEPDAAVDVPGETPFEKYKRLRAQSQGKPTDTDQGDADYLTKWNKGGSGFTGDNLSK